MHPVRPRCPPEGRHRLAVAMWQDTFLTAASNHVNLGS
jgi:hypothetical protein